MKSLKRLQKEAQKLVSSIEHIKHTEDAEKTIYVVSWRNKKDNKVFCDNLLQVEQKLLQIKQDLKLDRYNPEPIIYQNKSGAGDCCDNCKHTKNKRNGFFCTKLKHPVNCLGTCPNWEWRTT